METNYYLINKDNSCSMLDVLLINLKRSRMKIHLHRIMYIGEHELNFIQLEEFLKSTINKTNRDQRDEILYGLMLYYNKYFITTIEGSEESIFRHLDFLLDNNGQLGTIRVLIMLRVNQRTLTTPWQALHLTGIQEIAIEREGRRLEIWQEARVCVAKLHRLAGVLASREASVGGPLTDRSLLPEPAVLELLMQGSMLLNAKHFQKRSLSPEPASRYEDHVWPPNDPLQ